MSVDRNQSTPRDPLCEQALRTNRELRERVEALESGAAVREIERDLAKARHLIGIQRAQIRDLRRSPWVYLPWRGYVS